MKVRDIKTLLPRFEISRLSVRAAEEIPFPKYRDEFFSAGVSGKSGDYAFDTTKYEWFLPLLGLSRTCNEST